MAQDNHAYNNLPLVHIPMQRRTEYNWQNWVVKSAEKDYNNNIYIIKWFKYGSSSDSTSYGFISLLWAPPKIFASILLAR